MSKREFLDKLKEALNGEVTADIIDQNMEYYERYIGSHSDKKEEEVLDELGDPRLIARTIIDTYRISKQKNFTQEHNYNKSHSYYQTDNGKKKSGKRHGNYFKLRWYHKLEILLIIFILLSIIYLLGRLFIKLFLLFGMPILFILIIYLLFRKR